MCRRSFRRPAAKRAGGTCDRFAETPGPSGGPFPAGDGAPIQAKVIPMKKLVYAMILAMLATAPAYDKAAAAEKKSKNKKPAAEAAGASKKETKKSEATAEAELSEKKQDETAADAGEKKSGGNFFSMTTRSRVEEASEKRMNDRIFHAKISNEYFRIFEEEDDFVILAKLPFKEDETNYKVEFKTEKLVVVTFTKKSDAKESPVRYEINLPQPTLAESRRLIVKGELEITIPIDFFFEERKSMR